MLYQIYQKLLILGLTEEIISFTFLFISFFILFFLIRPVVCFLIRTKCYTLLSFLFAFLLIFSLTREWLREIASFDLKIYLYLLSVVASILTVRLLYKKVVKKVI